MDNDRLERLDRLGRYERYLRYIQIMDSMDMLEELCDSSLPMGQASGSSASFSRHAFKRRKILTKMKEDSDVEEESEDEEEALSSENDFESDEDSDESESGPQPDLAKKKPSVDFENPYRGLKDSENPLEALNDTDFLNSYKFSKKTIIDVMELIKDNLIKYSNRGVPVPPLIELLITVNYLTNGSGQKDAMKGVSQSSISRINTRVTDLIASLQDRFVKMPDKNEIEKNKIKFFERGRFPDVIGCIRSTHVGVRVKGIEKNYISSYVNENGYHSVRVQIHQLMLEDTERMVAYKTAIMNNKSYIEGKVVMDVGAGSGILSIFCAKAGAKKVYAVEASNLAKVAEAVIKENKLENIIQVIHSKVEDVVLPNDEKVDMIVSEWMGFYLLHEGMLDSVLVARNKFLKEDGSMFPESATIYMAPCSVPSMYDFWEDIHGVKMKSLSSIMRKNKQSKPEILHVEEDHLMGEKTALAWIDLKYDQATDLDCYTMKQIIGASRDGRYQGLCIWFDCQFPTLSGGDDPIMLCTAPSSPLTHWKQTVIVLPVEQILEKGDPIAWELTMKRSEESSRRYTLEVKLLDPMVEKHPTPCTCHLTKCIVIKTYLEQYPDGEQKNI